MRKTSKNVVYFTSMYSTEGVALIRSPVVAAWQQLQALPSRRE